MNRDTKEHNKQKQQKYNLLKLIFLYLLTSVFPYPFQMLMNLIHPNYCLHPYDTSKTLNLEKILTLPSKIFGKSEKDSYLCPRKARVAEW